ncbi:ABC transporter ATPase [Escherichia coli]|nr:ABC transporter ATPase [Escherichia coli]
MTHTLNPVITVTVSGPVGSGKSYVLARIEEVVKQELGNSVIVDAADVDDEHRMSGDDLSTWQKPRAGTIIRLEEYTERVTLSYGEERISLTNALLEAICPEGQAPWILPEALHAAIAALFVLYDQDLVLMELGKIIKATEK